MRVLRVLGVFHVRYIFVFYASVYAGANVCTRVCACVDLV